jgi:WLM domain
MVHGYFHRLSPFQQRVYRRSVEVAGIRVPAVAELHGVAGRLAKALPSGDVRVVTTACANLLHRICARLGVATPQVTVLADRPAGHWGELHGLYQAGDGGASPRITLWMRTARRRQVVAFRTFLRTLLHELCHHLDFALLGFDYSFHTAGFYRRESDLYRQLLPAEHAVRGRRGVAATLATGTA